MTSLARTLARDSHSNLFHHSAGKVSPTAGILNLGKSADDIIGETAEAHVDRLVHLAALLHERHHWLQYIGTNAGQFLTLLHDAQLTVGLAALERAPAGTTRIFEQATVSPDSGAWLQLELLRRLYFGGRTADIDGLSAYLGGVNLASTRNLLEQITEQIDEAVPGAALGRLARVVGMPPQEGARAPLLKVGRVSVGARHVMEGAARMTEIIKFNSDVHHSPHVDASAHEPRLEGVYGVLSQIFFDRRADSPSRTLAFSAVCDMALNTATTPFFPLERGLFTQAAFHPGTLFTVLMTSLDDFPFAEWDDKLRDADGVTALLEAIRDHLTRQGENAVRALAEARDRVLAPFVVEPFPPRMFTTRDGGLPTAVRGGAWRDYYWACAARSNTLRSENPGLFELPGLYYTADRKRFRELFDAISPPLLQYGQLGIAPARGVTGWLEFFVGYAMVEEIVAGLMCGTMEMTARRLAPLTRTFGEVDHGLAILAATLEGFPAWIRDDLARRTGAAYEGGSST